MEGIGTAPAFRYSDTPSAGGAAPARDGPRSGRRHPPAPPRAAARQRSSTPFPGGTSTPVWRRYSASSVRKRRSPRRRRTAHGRPQWRCGCGNSKAHEPAVVLLEADGLAGVGHIFFQKRPRRGVRLKIVPERTLADAHGKAREARHTAVNGALKRGGVNVPLHQRGEAVDGGILLLLQRGVENARIVEPIPFAVGFCHRFPPSFAIGHSGSIVAQACARTRK